MPVLRTVPPTLPSRLGKPPLVDSIFEVRFQPKEEGTAQLLPGLFFSKLSADYPRAEAMPIASIPLEIRQRDPALRYQSQYRLVGESAAISVGDRSAGVSALPPYQGWDSFKPRIDAFLSVLRASSLVKRLERFSLKFVNVLNVPADSQLQLLNLDAQLGGLPIPDQGFQLRAELNDTQLIRIVEVRPNATAVLPSGDARSGLLLSIDCIRQIVSENLEDLTGDALEEVHQDLKEVFFGLITKRTLEAFDPEY